MIFFNANSGPLDRQGAAQTYFRTGTSYTANPNAQGIAKTSITLRDGGGTDQGGQNSSTPETLDIIIAAVQDPIDVLIVDVTPDPRIKPVDEISIVFSEQVIGFDIADLELRRDGGENLINDTVTLTSNDSPFWTLGNIADLTGQPGEYTLTFDGSLSWVTNLSGKPVTENAIEVWSNDFDPNTGTSSRYDVNEDGRVSPLDVLLVINYLSRDPDGQPVGRIDVNRSGFVSPLDALLIINALALQQGAEGEGIDNSFAANLPTAEQSVPLSTHRQAADSAFATMDQSDLMGIEMLPQRPQMQRTMHQGQDAVQSRIDASKSKRNDYVDAVDTLLEDSFFFGNL